MTEDALLYYTWSQGYRAGGFNRGPCQRPNSPLAPEGALAGASPGPRRMGGALAFEPDDLTNNEVGWKTMWLDHRIQWDGAIYQENWNHAQMVGA